jgi:serine/threonine protein kinase
MICPHCNAPNAEDARFCGACGKATQTTEPTSNPPLDAGQLHMIGREIAGRFRILAKLGEGGMGTVYRAEQISLKRTVALKLLRHDIGGSSMLLQRFNAEAHAVAKLNHPNTVNIYDFGQDTDGTFFISMELVEGRSLRAVVHAEAPLPIRRALHIAQQICASIADAHSHAIVHRDLKPDNVMLAERGRAKDIVRVLDFGIAKLRDDNRVNNAMTQAGDMLGTPQYMAPEQIRAEQIDGRTDVYALGCMLYEMITARLPFEAPTVMALLSKHLMETPLPPSQRRPELRIPQMIDDLVMGAMAKHPDARPPTMELLGEHIAALLATLPADASGPSAPINVPYVPGYPSPNRATPTPFAPSAPPPTGPAGYTPAPYTQATGAAPYNPIPAPPTVQPAQPARPSGSGVNRLLLAIIGVLVLAGGGIAIYFATRDSTPPATTPDPPVDPDDPTNDEDKDPDDKPDDPWAGGITQPADPGAAAAGLPAGDPIDVGQGARFIVPPGFTQQTTPDATMVLDLGRGIVFGFVAIQADTDDPKILAERYAAGSGLKMTVISEQNVQGAPRKYAVFEGTDNNVQVRHLVITFLSASYRLAMIIAVPAALGNDPNVQAMVSEAAERRLLLP